MKKNTIIAGLLAASTLFGACSKELNFTPEGAPTETNFWKTSQDAINGSNALYTEFDDENFYGRGFFWFINASDDMVTGRVKAEGDNIKNFNASFIGGSYTEGQWKLRYIVIKRANDLLTHVPTITMDEAIKKRIIGEAHFMSGLMYFELAANYGNDKAGVPIIDPTKVSATATPRAKNVAENYAFIETELKAAADNLPYFNEYTTADYGRPHKTAAWAYLAKMYLYNKDYVNAAKYADMVINSGKHKLLDNFKDVFTIANNWSTEYIWSVTSSATSKDGFGSILPGVMLENKGWGLYNGWGYYMPTQELYNAYENGDLRREATILKPGDSVMYFGTKIKYQSTNSLSGYQFNKYMEPFGYASPVGTIISANGDHPTTGLNVPLIRYAEVLLIKAEAQIKQGLSGDAEINLIRHRAGLGPVSGADMTELKKQRRCELAGEFADRHRDLVRWGDAQATYALPLHGTLGQVVWPARTFNPEVHNVWPVPQSEIDGSAGVITQNAGW